LKFFRQYNYTEKAKILYFLIWFTFGWPMTKSCDLFTTDRPFVNLYDAIYKKGSKQIWVSVSFLSIFFLWNFTHVSKNRWRNINFIKKNEKDNQMTNPMTGRLIVTLGYMKQVPVLIRHNIGILLKHNKNIFDIPNSFCHNLYLSATFKQFFTEFAGFEIGFHVVYMWAPHIRSDWSNWPIKSHVGIWYAVTLTCKQHGSWFQNLWNRCLLWIVFIPRVTAVPPLTTLFF